jgi:retinol dehydrogenase-14
MRGSRGHAYGPMAGKTAVVTGASGGIGAVTARELARAGARIFLIGRDPNRTEMVAAAIEAESDAEVIGLACDFKRLSCVRETSREILESGDSVDVLCNNAAAIFRERTITEDGNESTFQVNYLAPFLMTHLLRPALALEPPSRVITVSSDAHVYVQGGIRFEDPTFERGWSSFRSYAHSKLADIMFAYALAQGWAGTGVSSNAMHPGVAATGLGRHGWGAFGFVYERAKVIFPTSEQAADTLLYLASSPDVEGASGLYYFRRKPKRSSRASYDRSAQRRLWSESLGVTGLPDTAEAKAGTTAEQDPRAEQHPTEMSRP